MPKRLIEAIISSSSKAGMTTFEAVSCRDKATFTFEDVNPRLKGLKRHWRLFQGS